MPRGDQERTPEDRERRRRERQRRERDKDRDPESRRERDRDGDRERRRRTDPDRDPERRHRRRHGHRKTESTNELLPREEESPSPIIAPKARRRDSSSYGYGTGESSRGSGKPLVAGSLAALDKANFKSGWGKGENGVDGGYVENVRRKEQKLEDARMEEEDAQRRENEAKEKEERRRAERERILAEKRRAERARRRDTDDMGIRVRPMDEDEDDTAGHRRGRKDYTDSEIDRKEERRRRRREERKRRVVSGPLAEEGDIHDDDYDAIPEKRGGAGGKSDADYYYEDLEAKRKRKKWIMIAIGVSLVLIAVIVIVAVVVSKKNKDSSSTADSGAASGKPANTELDGISESDIPESARGGLLDPFTWYDTTDFNVTYTEETVGGLSVMGLNSTWDDNVQANEKVPNLQDSFGYGKLPIRGVNVGGWLNIEPFITPSLFEQWSTRDGVIDEWTLTTKLGPTKAAQTLEAHYSSFITRKSFEDIRAAGFDHVRIPYGYWAVTIYDNDPYVARISWRYLLRGLEYARQSGLRVNLDLHGLPGSQNGWNHSGRQGTIGWLNGTDGDLNAQRSLDIHAQLSTFFAQPRYKNLITLYGLANEPRMVDLNTNAVLNWTKTATALIRANGLDHPIVVFGDGFMGLDKWQGRLADTPNLLLDVHQYVIFNTDQITLPHADKVAFACTDWSAQTLRSSDTETGFGPTICGEWSQADADCAPFINNVGQGTRWEGTYNTGNASTSVLDPTCPTHNNPTCSCAKANAEPGSYSEGYKAFLRDFAEAQMESFEKGWGWFYWTWETERAVQWSYRRGVEAGILPRRTWERGFRCEGRG
ncbi:glycoside hydrolase, partial [Pseudovirgaria hyperparasitica]